ncbi:MAG: P-loop NTPase [Deltaproteobacteria bacterium]|nr:P-loop NTPase [Deltaproteobacteria bacterium]
METNAVIIPVASGKGGVGKSLLTANLSIALAQAGHTTIAIDLDLGGSNLHYFLGVPNRFPGVGDFLKARRGELTDFLVPTSIPNLKFIPGDGKMSFMANIAYAQKMKLLRRIKDLSADYILLDLGAGSSYNTLDFFGLGKHGITVTTPEYPAIISMLGFLKSYLIRTIEKSLVKNRPVSRLLKELITKPIESQIPSIKELKNKLTTEEPEVKKLISKISKEFRPRIVFNRGTGPDDSKTASKISGSLRNVLNIEGDYFGFIFNDPVVNESVLNQTPLLTGYPNSIAAESITRIAGRIIKYWDKPVPNSSKLIFQHVQRSVNRV